MIDKELILDLLRDTESDRAERTVSTKDTDKYGEAICAFANDLPNHNRPGYLILGATDDGKIKGLNVTDELLKNIAAIRTDGNIQPQPSLVVAEAMKVMGFVNRFSRGVLRVEEELQDSGIGKPLFNLNLTTAFMVTEHISRRAEELEASKIKNSGDDGGERNYDDGGKSNGESTAKIAASNAIDGGEIIAKNGGEMAMNGGENYKLKFLLVSMPQLTMVEYAKRLRISKRQCKRFFADMKQKGLIARVGGARGGHWKIIDKGKD